MGLIVLPIFVCILVAQSLNEFERLLVLEAADDYYASEDRVPETAIGLYETVLREVDLSNENRVDVLFRVGTMYLTDRESPPTELDQTAAQKIFLELVDIAPYSDWRSLQSRVYIANIYQVNAQVELAIQWYLSAWDGIQEVNTRLRVSSSTLRSIARGAITSLSELIAGLPNKSNSEQLLRDLRSRYASNPEFLNAMDASIRHWHEVQIRGLSHALESEASRQTMETIDELHASLNELHQGTDNAHTTRPSAEVPPAHVQGDSNSQWTDMNDEGGKLHNSFPILIGALAAAIISVAFVWVSLGTNKGKK